MSYARRRRPSYHSGRFDDAGDNSDDDLLAVINEIELSHIKGSLKRVFTKLNGRNKLQLPSVSATNPVIPGDVMDFITQTEDSHAQASLDLHAAKGMRDLTGAHPPSELPMEMSDAEDVGSVDKTTSKIAGKSKGKEVDHGQPLHIGASFANPFRTAESKIRERNTSVDILIDPIERHKTTQAKPSNPPPSQTIDGLNRRCNINPNNLTSIESLPLKKRTHSRSSTFFDDPSDPLAALEDKLLEPCPELPTRKSFGEVMDESFEDSDIAAGRSRASTFSSSGGTTLRTRSIATLHKPSYAHRIAYQNTSVSYAPPKFWSLDYDVP
jgi:hypothetical protein